jgi:post-segregation antitoxin (ccd killing protein)
MLRKNVFAGVDYRRMVRRMPRLQVYLPDDLYEALKAHGLPASELLQEAVRAELERRDALDAVDEYLAELGEEVGEPSARQVSRADAVTQRIRNHALHQAG